MDERTWYPAAQWWQNSCNMDAKRRGEIVTTKTMNVARPCCYICGHTSKWFYHVRSDADGRVYGRFFCNRHKF